MNLSKYDWKFKLFGIPVRVMVTFWLICIFFSPFLKGYEGPWLFGLFGWSAALLLSVLAHETGHALAMRRLYGGTPRIDLGIGRTSSGAFVFGGLTTSYVADSVPIKRALVSAAGPVAGIVLSLAFALILALFGVRFGVDFFLGVPIPEPDPRSFAFLRVPALLYFVYFFVYGFVWVGLVWGLFNLAPIVPFDGGHILLAVFTSLFGRREGARWALVISFVAAITLAILFIARGNFIMTLFCLFIAYQNYQLQMYGRF